MSNSATANPPPWAPWESLLKWSPFKIDALGLITLLGAEEINASVGRLVRSRWLEYLPFLGAYVIAGNRFRQKEAGFNLYNITQGIHTPDLAPWLTRWMKSQDFVATRSFVRWTVVPPRYRPFDDVIAAGISICLVGVLFAFTILQYDMYGMGSTLAMAWSAFSRWYMIRSVRESIDDRVSEMCREKKDAKGNPISVAPENMTYEWRMKTWNNRTSKGDSASSGNSENDPEKGAVAGSAESVEEPHRLACGWNGTKLLKILVITSESLAVTMMVPKELMGPNSVFSANLPPRHGFWYGVARWTGWISFAVQVVTIGQADLFIQICTVGLLVIPTVLYIGKFGCDDSNWARNIKWAWYWCLDTEPKLDGAAQQKAHGAFSAKSVSQIGSRLVAEVYEWPLSHEFVEDPPDSGTFVSRKHDCTSAGERTRRKHLYAWLQLSETERLSMDKWDLFPHERDDNQEWMKTYNQFKDLITNLEMPVGSIGSIRALCVEGAQTVMDRSDAATQEADDSAQSPIAGVGGAQVPNGTAAESQHKQRLEATESEVADDPEPQDSHAAVHFTDSTALGPPPRTGTNLTQGSAAQASVTSRHSSRRRESVSDHNPAFWMSNIVLQEQADRKDQEEGTESGNESTQT